jgi:hypothetical protein
MRAEFYVPDAPDQVVGRARWGAQGIEVEADHADARGKLDRIFRPTAVVVDDPALRSFGTSGPTVLQPGSLRWFHEAALARAKEDGLAARLVPETVAVDYDPAGLYRTFDKQWERRETSTRSRSS